MKTRYPGIYTRTLKDGAVVYDATATVDGKQRQTRGHKTLALAKDAQDAMRHDLRKNRRGAATPRMTLAEYLEERWLPYANANLLKSTESVRAYRRAVNQLIEVAGDIRLRAMEPLDAEDIKARLLARRGKASAAQAYARLVQSLNDAVMWRLISHNPCAGLRRIPEPKRVQPVFSIELLQRILVAADKTAYGDLIFLTMLAGLRWKEISTLLWSDIDFAESTLRIRRPNTKTQAGARAVWLGPDTVERLQQHRQHQMKRAKSLRNDDAPAPTLVFTSPMELQLNRRHFEESVWVGIRAEAGVPEMHFHDLRHAQGTLLARARVHPRIAQERLGHADIRTTMHVYTQISAVDQREGAEAVEGLLRRETEMRREP